MYEKHFGLARRPFTATADPPAYYPSTGQEAALTELAQALRQQEGFAVLTGETGTGKTALIHRLLERLDANAVAHWLTHPQFTNVAAFYQALLFDQGLPYEGKSEQELRLLETGHLLETFGQGKQTVLIVDEAHHLTPGLLEEVRLLGNLETRLGKALQVVLVGQPALLDQLRLPQLSSLAQRVRARATLQPLDVHESVDYLLHQLKAAGGRPDRLITEEALELLARGSRGVPRLLNQAADLAFALAHAAQQPTVDAEAALEALQQLGLAAEANEQEASLSSPSRAAGKPEGLAGTDASVFFDADKDPHAGQGADPSRPRRLFASSRRTA